MISTASSVNMVELVSDPRIGISNVRSNEPTVLGFMVVQVIFPLILLVNWPAIEIATGSIYA